MKIVVIGHPLVVNQNRLTWRQLAHDHPEIQVIIIPPSTWSTDRYGPNVTYSVQSEKQANYEVIPLDLSQGHFSQYIGLSSFLKREKPDILCIAQERYSWSTLLALLCCRLNTPTTKTISLNLTNIDYVLKLPHRYIKEQLFFHSCDAILSADHEAFRILKDHGYKGFSWISYPLGSVESPVYLMPYVERVLPPLIIGYVGSLTAEKGVKDLIEAASQLEGQWHLRLIGDGPQAEELKELVRRLGIEKQVNFMGMMSRQNVMEQLQALHTLILPSHSTSFWKEQFGVVLPEAMISGTPVIGSTCGAIPEVIGDAGLIFPEGDIQALANCLQRIYDDPILRVDLATRGRQRALERYSASAMAKEFYQFCIDILKTR